MPPSKRVLVLPLFILAAVLLALGVFVYFRQTQVTQVYDFDSCAAAGYPIMESYPEQCATPDGRTFVRVLPVTSPMPTPQPHISPLPPGEPITVTGQFTCLPHRDQTGPQTMECAFGLQTDEGDYYGLRDSDPNYQNLMLPTGSRVTVTGIFTPQPNIKYQSLGVIEVQSVTQE